MQMMVYGVVMTTSETDASDLRWFADKAELAAFRSMKFGCVYAIGPQAGRPVKIRWGTNPVVRLNEMQESNWKDLKIHHVVWCPSEGLAARLQGEVYRLLDAGNRRVVRDWFDVTPEWVQRTFQVAGRNQSIPIFSNDAMIERVRATHQARVAMDIARVDAFA